jgi:hypothetical protein
LKALLECVVVEGPRGRRWKCLIGEGGEGGGGTATRERHARNGARAGGTRGITRKGVISQMIYQHSSLEESPGYISTHLSTGDP